MGNGIGIIIISREPRSLAEARKVKSSLPTWHVVKPDNDNICKLYGDALSRPQNKCSSGLPPLTPDDARFAVNLLIKVRTARTEAPRVDVLIWDLKQPPDPLALACALIDATS